MLVKALRAKIYKRIMQKLKLISSVVVIALALSSCNGDHGSQGGKDTAQNSYQVPKDTTKADSTGADTSSVDNSANGGTEIAKPDTHKHK